MPQLHHPLLPSIALLAISVPSCSTLQDVDVDHGVGVDVVATDVQDVSLPLHDLANAAPVPVVAALAAPSLAPVSPVGSPGGAIAQAAVAAPQLSAPLVNFEGQGKGLAGFNVTSGAPDAIGAIGRNHYVQAVNFQLAVFNRLGQPVFGPVTTSTLWSGFAGECANTNDGSPSVRYDRIADRWVISQVSSHGGAGPFFQCVAVSTSPDPTGTYHRYQFPYSALNDSPKLSLWPDAYYFTFNMFAPGTFAFLGGKACALDRAKLLTGAAATMQCFDTGPQFGNLLAADFDGARLPPAGAPNLHVALTKDALATWQFHVDFATPTNSSFTGPTMVPVEAYTPLCSSGPCVSQPGTTQTLDSLGDRLMGPLSYRNFGTHESLVVTHAVTAGTSGGVRFYELRTPATPSLFQQGTYAPDANYRWMSSAAMDKTGNLAIGFSTSGSTLSPSIRYAGRLANDPAGTMPQSETTLIAGTGAQTGLSRWGDYSSMSLDPTDDCTLWYTQQYVATTGAFNWHTRVGSFRFASCVAPANDFALESIPALTLGAGTSNVITVGTSVIAGAAEPVTFSVSGLSSGVTASFSPASVTAGGSSTLTLTADATAAAGTTLFSIVGKAPSATRTTTVAVAVTVVVTNQPPTVSILAPANATVSGNLAIGAAAADVDGTIASVKFDLPDGTSVVDTAAPYEAPWNSATVSDGTYVIRATATDSQGATAQTSTTVIVANNGGCIANTFTAVGLPLNIPDNKAAGITSELPVVGNGSVGTLALSLAITHPFRGDLKVTLVSPGGKQFVVSNRAGGSADNLVISNMPLPAFVGDTAAGTWKLVVADLAAVDVGTLTSWSLRINGSCSVEPPWSGSATPNLPTIDNGTACTSLNVTGTGDASTAKLDIAGRHDFRNVLRGTIAHNGVTVAAFPTSTFPSGAGAFSFANRAVSGITGSASGTWTLCIVDTDAFGDTGTLTSWSVHN